MMSVGPKRSRSFRSSTRSATFPIDRHSATVFFQLVSRRYERGAIILMDAAAGCSN
jgi:hypothetical protein